MKTSFLRFPLLWALLPLLFPLFGGKGEAADPEGLYDLCARYDRLNDGRVFFTRHRNPTLDPVLQTLELYTFDPGTGKITLLQRPDEHIYIPPVISRDRTTICYQSILDGRDYLVTRDALRGNPTRLGFDTGGYFVRIALDFDNDTVVSALKRGTNRQALYIISNRAGTIRRFFNGRDFRDIGFLANGDVYFTDQREEELRLGVVTPFTTRQVVLSESVEFVEPAPNGDALLYKDGAGRNVGSTGEPTQPLLLYRANNGEKILLSENSRGRPLISPDGSTCAVLEGGGIKIVNIPSGDVLYLLPVQAEPEKVFLTDFSLFIVREGRIFQLRHKKPAERLREIHRVEGILQPLGVSSNGRFFYYRGDDGGTVHVFDVKDGSVFSKKFPFQVFDILTPRDEASDGSIYLRGTVRADGRLVRGLYYYDVSAGALLSVSTPLDTDIRPYFRTDRE
jgi:hypothetical protein